MLRRRHPRRQPRCTGLPWRSRERPRRADISGGGSSPGWRSRFRSPFVLTDLLEQAVTGPDRLAPGATAMREVGSSPRLA